MSTKKKIADEEKPDETTEDDLLDMLQNALDTLELVVNFFSTREGGPSLKAFKAWMETPPPEPEGK